MRLVTKVMVATSDGGHWVQMRRILPAFEGFELVYCGVAARLDADLAPARYHVLGNVSRKNPHKLVLLVWRLARILRAERPDVVVTTGAAPGLVALALGKLLVGSRTIWIDSIANTDRISLSGRMARHVADAWLVQWEHLSAPEGPQYWGAVL